MSSDNNNSDTSAPHEIKCHFLNKYEKWYWEAILKYSEQPSEEGTQGHHIIPRCIWKSKENKSLVHVTPRQHYLLHLLLFEAYRLEPLRRSLIFASKESKVAKSKVKGCKPTRGTKGMKISPERRKQISESLRGRKVSEETRAKIGKAHKGKKQSEKAMENFLAMREFQKTRPWRNSFVTCSEERLLNWSKSTEIYDLVSDGYNTKAEVIREVGATSRRIASRIIVMIEKGWNPYLDEEFLKDFVKI